MLFILWLIVRLLARLLVLSNDDDGAKDLEILVLRQQLRVLRRKSGRPKFTARDRVLLAAASRVLPRQRWASLLVTPQTLLRWHRTLVRRKWTYGKERTPGRPPIDPQTAELILRMARENSRWGCVRICGELRKLGIRVGATTIRTLLRQHGLGPAPGPHRTDLGTVPARPSRRDRGLRLPHGGDDLAADPVRLVLHPGEHQAGRGRRRHGPARLELGYPAGQERHDGPERSAVVDPVPAPRPRRQVHSRLRRGIPHRGRSGHPHTDPGAASECLRRAMGADHPGECLDWTLVLGRRHLLRLLRGYVRHYNQQRPHRSLALAVPEPEAREQSSPQGNPREVRRRDVLGGLIHEYHEVAA